MKWLNLLFAALAVLAILTNGSPAFASSESGDMEDMEDIDIFDDDYDEFAEKIERMPDPLESYNRLIFKINDKLYFYLLKPTARAYKVVLPEKARISVGNMLSNILMPIRFLNCLLQGKLKGSAIELSRFTVNTTWGIAGLFDPAKSCLHLEEQKEDFGQTLGFYGLKEGFYITWPFLGPSDLRDTVGLVADYFSDPLVYYKPLIKTGATTLDKVNHTSLTLGDYEEFKKSAFDPYVSLRNAYFQHRRSLIKR